MSNQLPDNAKVEANEQEERKLLMSRAKMMKITFSNNISTEKLRERVNAKLNGEPDPVDEPDVVNPLAASVDSTDTSETAAQPKKKKVSLRKRLRDENLKLVRCRIFNLDPKKRDLPGEIITFANEYIGSVRKFIPFGEQTDNGYHIPYCIYKILKSRKFLHIGTKKDPKSGRPITYTRDVPEFNIEILPPLTQKELDKLARDQRAAANID